MLYLPRPNVYGYIEGREALFCLVCSFFFSFLSCCVFLFLLLSIVVFVQVKYKFWTSHYIPTYTSCGKKKIKSLYQALSEDQLLHILHIKSWTRAVNLNVLGTTMQLGWKLQRQRWGELHFISMEETGTTYQPLDQYSERVLLLLYMMWIRHYE